MNHRLCITTKGHETFSHRSSVTRARWARQTFYTRLTSIAFCSISLSDIFLYKFLQDYHGQTKFLVCSWVFYFNRNLNIVSSVIKTKRENLKIFRFRMDKCRQMKITSGTLVVLALFAATAVRCQSEYKAFLKSYLFILFLVELVSRFSCINSSGYFVLDRVTVFNDSWIKLLQVCYRNVKDGVALVSALIKRHTLF